MPSRARAHVLSAVLGDVDQLLEVHEDVSGTGVGRRWNVDAVNRSGIALSIAAWEGFVEELVREATGLFAPGPGAMLVVTNAWQVLSALASSKAGRLHTPDTENVRRLFSETVGPPDVTLGWTWQNMKATQAATNLEDWLTLRHQVVHGVTTPGSSGALQRPRVSKAQVKDCREFIASLAEATENNVKSHLQTAYGISAPW